MKNIPEQDFDCDDGVSMSLGTEGDHLSLSDSDLALVPRGAVTTGPEGEPLVRSRLRYLRAKRNKIDEQIRVLERAERLLYGPSEE
jgi:hypothetical protein